MKRRMPAVLSLLLVGLVLILPGCFAGDTQDEPTAIIGPGVLEALETETEIDVLISLGGLDIPVEEQTTEDKRRNASERQARVLSVLTASDFTLNRKFEISAGFTGRITKDGLQKLATHPDVTAIALNGALEWE